MKKSKIIIGIILLITLYALTIIDHRSQINARNTPREAPPISDQAQRNRDLATERREILAAINQLNQPNRPSQLLSRENMLYDAEYMLAILRADFTYFGIAYRQAGVCIYAIEAELLAAIASAPARMNAVQFRRLLHDYFVSQIRFAHLAVIEPNQRAATNPAFIMPLNERISFESVIPGIAAYMNIANFLIAEHLRDEANRAIADFYASIADYEHLIIDFRGIPGGHLDWAIENFISPFMQDDFEDISFSFMANWESPADFLRRDGVSRLSAQTPNDILPIGELLRRYYLPALNPDDKRLFSYGFKNTNQIYAREIYGFDGKIWFLIGGGASATTLAAGLVQDMELGTLVGRPTLGFTGSARHRIPLPHSRLVLTFDAIHMTDRHGRSQEYGISPHIFADDPLAYVLAKIELLNH